ncbi:MAG: DUF89 family protein [Deltaproteobacteria bacterium]|nr:DUF89 family protein [Deltaproteobacteria bacterium]
MAALKMEGFVKASPECILCMFKQGLNTVRLVTDDPEIHQRVLVKIAKMVEGISLDTSPAALSTPVYRIVSEVTGVDDPYEAVKAETNREALALLPELENMIARTENPLEMSLYLAAAGNVIDLGIGHSYDLIKDIQAVREQGFALYDFEDFRRELKAGVRILYLGDNSGEIVFDRLFVERLLQAGAEVVYSVKSGPIINDAMMKDARDTGMTGLVTVIETGVADIGVNMEQSSPGFKEAYQSADVIISKGHGNFETCVSNSENIYFLLKAKCPVVARELGVSEGGMVFKRNVRQ